MTVTAMTVTARSLSRRCRPGDPAARPVTARGCSRPPGSESAALTGDALPAAAGCPIDFVTGSQLAVLLLVPLE